MPHLAIFASSSESLPAALHDRIETLATDLARRGWDLVFGGSKLGLMRVAAEAFRRQGREVVSVIPRAFDARGLTFADSTEVIHTEDLRDRKRIMADRAQAFLALPGGPGTLDEFIELLSLKIVGMNAAPLVLFDPEDHWVDLLRLFDSMRGGGFAHREPREHFVHARSATEVLTALPLPGRA
ncbi:MAG: TIGR00730 family Rossman fold protein [Planctomycetes bacterium]|nr:TIGR00730 family Rossman fold protein [Planctomycetota bacterium]